MSRYEEELKKMTVWFCDRMKNMRPFSMSEEEYQDGTDALPKRFKQLVREANTHWVEKIKYEPGYSQLNRAFFAAAFQLGKLSITCHHPVFTLNTPVFIKELVREDGTTAMNVIATITRIQRDDKRYVLVYAYKPFGKPYQRFYISLALEELDAKLTLRTA